MASTLRGPIRRSPYVQQWVPFIVLVLGCVLTAAAVTTIATRQEVATANAFRADTLAVQRVTQVQLDTVVGVTHAAAALLSASPEINFREFRAFVSGLQLRERYVGVEGIDVTATSKLTTTLPTGDHKVTVASGFITPATLKK